METTELEALGQQGQQHMRAFIDGIGALTEYVPSRADKEAQEEEGLSLLERLQHFYARFLFARFAFWFLAIMILSSIGVFLFNRIVSISPDTMVTIVMTTSVAGATGLAAVLPRK